MLPLALLFAVVQGATEFLPVSSSGHLRLLWLLPDGPPQAGALIVYLHAGTNLAGIVYFRRMYWRALCDLRRPGPGRRFALHYVLALAATAVIAIPEALLLSRTSLSDLWASPWFVGWMMVANAGLLIAAPRGDERGDNNATPRISWRGSLLVGLAQGVSTVPGISRSGVTIAAGLAVGTSRADAVNFSFLLAGPVMLGAVVVWTVAFWGGSSLWFASWESGAYLLIAAAASFAVALGAIHWLVGWVRAGRLWWFAPWSAALGATAIALGPVW